MEKALIDVLTPIMESSIVLASHYAKCSGRDVVTGTDLEMSLKYLAQHEVGTHIGSLFPEIYDDSDSEDEDSIEEVNEENTPEFTWYSGDDDMCNKMNKASETWETWEPTCPAEILLRRAIDSFGKKM